VPESSLVVLLEGFTLFAGLIIAIGAQNAFVLRQGLLRQYVFATASTCFLCDVTLITIGAIGFGTLRSKVPGLTTAAAWGSAVFLLFYGLHSFKSALAPVALDIDEVDIRAKSLHSTVLKTLALSLLNPHVYIDIVLVGSLAARYSASQRIFFALGANLASLTWFFGLAYGAAWLTPLFRRPSSWRILDIIIGSLMWSIAVSLLFAALNNSL
jgi:L-lysine exporter family protein LysE/ArgO